MTIETSRDESKRRRLSSQRRAAILLSLLSPFFAEVLSGSTPPLEVINPLSFLFLWAFYGGGVLMIRELWIRWGKGCLRLMILGAIYGIVEEGLTIKSWFDPNWKDLGILGVYGRVWGVNTVWATWLTIFHSLMSISMPVLVIEALYPQHRDRPLLGRKGFMIATGSFTASGLLMFFFLNPYRPPLVQYSLTLLLVALLIILGRRLERPSLVTSKIAARHPFVYGFTIAFSLFFIYTVLPHSSVPPAVTMLIGILLALHLYSQLGSLDGSKRFFMVLGFLAFWFIPYDAILELNGVFGEAIIGITTFTVLLLKWKATSRDYTYRAPGE